MSLLSVMDRSQIALASALFYIPVGSSYNRDIKQLEWDEF